MTFSAKLRAFIFRGAYPLSVIYRKKCIQPRISVIQYYEFSFPVAFSRCRHTVFFCISPTAARRRSNRYCCPQLRQPPTSPGIHSPRQTRPSPSQALHPPTHRTAHCLPLSGESGPDRTAERVFGAAYLSCLLLLRPQAAFRGIYLHIEKRSNVWQKN